MAFFVNPGKDWENNLTEEDIAKLEAQGCDVSGLRNRPPVPEDDDEEELAEALEEIIEYVRTIAMLFYTHFNDDEQEIKPILH